MSPAHLRAGSVPDFCIIKIHANRENRHASLRTSPFKGANEQGWHKRTIPLCKIGTSNRTASIFRCLHFFEKISKELCEGGSVGDWLACLGGRLSLAKAAPIFLQSLEGLAHAHAKGFVHRDLKPHDRVSFLNLKGTSNNPVFSDFHIDGLVA